MISNSSKRDKYGKNLWSFIYFLTLCSGAAFIGSYYTRLSISTWYSSLVKPGWTPPHAVFTPVWGIFYLSMAVSGWLVWLKRNNPERALPALKLFALQLLLNMLWSGIFFGLCLPGAALVEILVLWVLIGFTLKSFWRISRPAGILLIPYWIWVSFAGFLNFSIWKLNSV